jgi:pimeloyl-ACP methyl ester carboxylesterase
MGFSLHGRALSAELMLPSELGARPFVLLLNNRGTGEVVAQELARSLVRRGFGTVTLDIKQVDSGVEESRAVAVKRHLSLAQAAFDAMFEVQQSEATALFAVGQSYGGYVAAALAENRPLAGVVLRSPLPWPDESVESASVWHERALSALKRSQVPVLVVSSERDELMPLAAIKSYLAAAGGTKAHYQIAGAGHELNRSQNRQFKRMSGEWLEARVDLAF